MYAEPYAATVAPPGRRAVCQVPSAATAHTPRANGKCTNVRDVCEDELDDWMARLALGDRSAFEPLYRALHPRALRFCRAKLGSLDAEDVAHEILERVFFRAAEFESGRPVLPWFYAVAANQVRTVIRRRQRRKRLDDVHPEPPHANDPEAELVDREVRSALDQAIAKLDGESHDAIQSLLGERARPDVPPATFRKRVSRIYARLRGALGVPDGD